MSVLHQCTMIHGIARKPFTMHANQTHSEPANCWVYKVAAHTDTHMHTLRLSACCRLCSKQGLKRERERAYYYACQPGLGIRPEHYNQSNYTSHSLTFFPLDSFPHMSGWFSL